MKIEETFYQQIERYYDGDAGDFDARYWQNPVLQRIRQDFREEVKRFPFTSMLEIGYGTGLDLVHFGKTHPHVEVAGIDISEGMHNMAVNRIRKDGLENVTAKKGKVEDLENLFPGKKFDLIYVFFGALNTVEDLGKTARILHRFTSGNGILVLSFVNKYYLGGMLIEILKLRFRTAFSRLNPEWGGYSPSRHLPSRCYSPGEINQAFSCFKLVSRKGYSIVHPAWYYHRLNRLLRRFHRILWKTDLLFRKTPLWKYGEYALYIFKKPDNIS
jgi:ubiquinone/menaquinone biosynthesis C-methylase UbiE